MILHCTVPSSDRNDTGRRSHETWSTVHLCFCFYPVRYRSRTTKNYIDMVTSKIITTNNLNNAARGGLEGTALKFLQWYPRFKILVEGCVDEYRIEGQLKFFLAACMILGQTSLFRTWGHSIRQNSRCSQ